MALFTSCSQKEACKCEKQDEEIARLKQELNKKNDLYLGLDEAMHNADESLSNIRTEKAAIDSILRLPGALHNKTLLLNKVQAMQQYVKDSRKNIGVLETQLRIAKKRGQNVDALKLMIKQLKGELDEKDAMIAVLQGRVQNLEKNLVAIQNDLAKEKEARELAEAGTKTAVDEVKKTEKAFDKYKNNPAIEQVDIYADRAPDRVGSISKRSVKTLSVKFNVPVNKYMEKGKRYFVYIDLIKPNNRVFRPRREHKDPRGRKHTAKAEFIYIAQDNQVETITFDARRKTFGNNLKVGIHKVKFFLDGKELNGSAINQGKNATISFNN